MTLLTGASLERPPMPGISGDVGALGETMHYDLHLCCLGEWLAARGWIHPQRGIRQGCPLAPLLFILAVDALVACTSQVCLRGALTGFQSASLLGGIPLLQYADDTTFFIQGSMTAAQALSTMMDIFSDFSGLQLNRAKSTFVRFGLPVEEMSGCSQILATPIGVLPIPYLGVPLLDRRLQLQD